MGTYVNNTDGHVCCQQIRAERFVGTKLRKHIIIPMLFIVLEYRLISHLYTSRYFVNCLKLLPVYSAIAESGIVSS